MTMANIASMLANSAALSRGMGDRRDNNDDWE